MKRGRSRNKSPGSGWAVHSGDVKPGDPSFGDEGIKPLATTLEREPDKRAGSAWKAAGTRKGMGCKSSSLRMNGPCEHRRLKQDHQPCKMHDNDPDDPQCCWAQCVDCEGMLHMLRVRNHELTDLDEVIDFES